MKRITIEALTYFRDFILLEILVLAEEQHLIFTFKEREGQYRYLEMDFRGYESEIDINHLTSVMNEKNSKVNYNVRMKDNYFVETLTFKKTRKPGIQIKRKDSYNLDSSSMFQELTFREKYQLLKTYEEAYILSCIENTEYEKFLVKKLYEKIMQDSQWDIKEKTIEYEKFNFRLVYNENFVLVKPVDKDVIMARIEKDNFFILEDRHVFDVNNYTAELIMAIL